MSGPHAWFCGVTARGDRLLSPQPGYRFFKPGGLFGIKQSEEPYAEGQQMQEESKILVSPCAGRCSARPGAVAGDRPWRGMFLLGAEAILGQFAAILGQFVASWASLRPFWASLRPFWASLWPLGPVCGHFGPVSGKFLPSLPPTPLSASQGWGGLWAGP